MSLKLDALRFDYKLEKLIVAIHEAEALQLKTLAATNSGQLDLERSIKFMAVIHQDLEEEKQKFLKICVKNNYATEWQIRLLIANVYKSESYRAFNEFILK